MKYHIGLCLLLAGNVLSQYMDLRSVSSGEALARLREEYKDPENLKKDLMSSFRMEPSIFSETNLSFKESFGITDDTLRTALMGIYQSVQHLGGESVQMDEPLERFEDRRRLLHATQWLGYCADDATKRLLLDIANDDTNDNTYRTFAVIASVQCSDAQEVRDVLVRFLVDMRVTPYITYLYVTRVHDAAKEDSPKREAILATLMVVLAREEDKNYFALMDKWLAERSKEYATSSQRLAMLQRMSKLPPSPFSYTDPDIKAALKSFRFRLFKTNVSTNMTELMARDFSKPAEVKKTKGE